MKNKISMLGEQVGKWNMPSGNPFFLRLDLKSLANVIGFYVLEFEHPGIFTQEAGRVSRRCFI